MSGNNKQAQVEQVAFSMFALESSEDYKRLVTLLVLRSIEANPGISTDRLAYKLYAEHRIDKRDINGALSALTSPLAFGSLVSWTPKQNRGKTKKLVKIANSGPTARLAAWISSTLHANPHLTTVQ